MASCIELRAVYADGRVERWEGDDADRILECAEYMLGRVYEEGLPEGVITQPTSETNEQRWKRLGHPFEWSDKYRAYHNPINLYDDDAAWQAGGCPDGAVLQTVAEVDAWIAAHPLKEKKP
jgi:hypothetical protein